MCEKLIPCFLCTDENIVYMESSKKLERPERLKLINFLKQRPPCKLDKIEIVREVAKCDHLQETIDNIPEFAMKNILEFWRKLPCLWYEKHQRENSHLIEPAYLKLTSYFNEQLLQDKTVDWMRAFLKKIRKEFFDKYQKPNRFIPWYHECMTFLLRSPINSVEQTILTDFECSLCLQRFTSQRNLIIHLYMLHLSTKLDAEELASQDWTMETVRGPLWEINEELGKEMLDEFISAYKKRTCLWDLRCDDYFREGTRIHALEELTLMLQHYSPDANLEDVKVKIEYLRTQFNQEHEKVMNARITGVEYIPTLWYYKRMEFILNERMQIITPAKICIRKCDTCNKLFTNPFVWWYHSNYGHQSNDGLFACQLCGLKKDNENSIVRHMRFCHLIRQNFCNECKINFPCMSMLAKHRVSAHNDIIPYRCSQCGTGFRDLYHAELHFINHWYVDERRYNCAFCEGSFTKQTLLNAHICRHFRCGLSLGCKMFQSAAQMIQSHFHMTADNKPNTYTCSKCEDSYPTMIDLMLHCNRKHGIKRYPCRLCENQFESLRSLHYHFQQHNPISDHECLYCGMKYVYECELKKHVKRDHSPIRQSYDCAYCGKKFISRPMLRQHVDMRHRAPLMFPTSNSVNQVNQCLICGEKIVGNNAMYNHIKARHYFETPPVQAKMDKVKFQEIKLRVMKSLCKYSYP